MAARPRGLLILVLFLAVGAFGAFVFVSLLAGTAGQDWMVFDTAARAYLDGHGSLLLDGVQLTRVLNAAHPTLRQPIVFHPWVYPPYTLLLVLPFALLSWPLSYGGFQLLSFAAMAAGLRAWLPDWRRFAVVLGGVAICPAAVYTVGAGQNSFLSAALLLGGMKLLDARPIAAGALLGLLAYKPQLGLLIPVALLAGRAWRAMAGATAMVVALVAASLVVPGVVIWRGWLELFLHGSQTPRQWVELYGQSVFTYLRLLGLTPAGANGGQAAALVIAAILVWHAFRTPMPAIRRLAALLAAISFSAPHFGDYDAILLGITAMLLLLSPEIARTRGLVALSCLVWCTTAVNPPYLFYQTIRPIFYLSELTPLIILALALCLARRRVPPVIIAGPAI